MFWRVLYTFTAMKVVILAVIGAALMVSGQETKSLSNAHKRDSAAESKDATHPTGQTVVVVNQQTPQGQENNHATKSPSYLHELLQPQNIPNIALAVVGVIGIVIAIRTLKAINHQVYEMRRQGHETRKQRLIMARQLGTMQGQLGQMESAGRQTNEMIEQASKQVDLMEKAGIHTEGLAQQAVRQADLTQQELELEHRPWIAVDVAASSPIIFDERGCVLMVNFTMTNVGRSVAKHVSLWTDFAILGIDDPMKVRDRLCDIMKQPQNENSDYGWLLFPNQRTVEQRGVIAVPERVQEALDMKIFQGLNAVGLHLVGCVDYPSPIDPRKRHQTRIVYNVSYVDTAKGRVMGAFDHSVKTYSNITFLPTLHGASAD